MGEITIQATDGAGSFKAYLAEPARKPAGAVVMIQEIFGVNRTMRALSDWVAAMGFFALAPDLFWRQEAGVELDPDAGQAQWDRAFALMKGMDQAKAIEDLKATVAAARALPGCNGKVGTMGYCLGGRLAFLMALESDAQCHVSYYGVGLEGLVGQAGRITAPTLLHIAERDRFVPPEAQAAIRAALAGHPHCTVMVHPGVDHAFARVGAHSYDARAATIANGRSAELLARTLD
ncbi:MAG: dienelactone hydrolase family protein [Rhodovarius sp.]|nr:dienelactone hydrolase family protein [Rhodovarius sp.]MDW8314259.1 dienelactone hydrolase family protein [Rhodovarius sp.]